MDIPAPTISSFSLETFESFIKDNPGATNIGISEGRIVERNPAEDPDQVRTKEAFQQALVEKYPDQAALVEAAFHDLQVSGKTWSAHTIKQVIKQAAENEDSSVLREGVNSDQETSQENINQLARAINDYADKIVEQLSPEEQGALQEQLAASSLAIGGAGFVGLVANLSTPEANAALAHLITTISASLPQGAALPMMGAAAPSALATGHAVAASLPATHLAAAAALMGSATTVTASAVAVEASIAAAAPAIATFIIAGAVAHRLWLVARRVQIQATAAEHRMRHLENEIMMITTGMIGAACATIPPAQHALLIGAIIGGMAGQNFLDEGLLHNAFHTIRDGALGAYLWAHPEVTVAIGRALKTFLFSVGKAVASASGVSSVANPVSATTTVGIAAATTTTTAAAVTTTATAGAASSTSTVGSTTAAHVASTSFLPHYITAMVPHGLSSATATVTAVIAAHPIAATAIIVGGACALAYQYTSGSSSSTTSANTSEDSTA